MMKFKSYVFAISLIFGGINLIDFNTSSIAQTNFNFGGTPITGSGKCIGTANGSSKNGTRIVIWECNGNPDQNWNSSNGTIQGIGGKCLGIRGNFVILWECNGNPDQNWGF